MALLFQSNPDQWNLREFFEPGDKVSWFVSRYISHMKKGTLTLLWEAQGTKKVEVKGLYGWGILLDQPERDVRGRLRVSLQYIERWVSETNKKNDLKKSDHVAAISADEVFKLASWRNHLIARMPIGTNFLLNIEQLDEINNLVTARYPKSQFSNAISIEKSGKPLNPDEFEKTSIPEKELSIKEGHDG